MPSVLFRSLKSAALALSVVLASQLSAQANGFAPNASQIPSAEFSQGNIVLAQVSLERRANENINKVSTRVTRTGEIYLLRGLANVFSRGMDTLGAKMNRAGLDARVFNHAAWEELAYNIHLRNKYSKISHPIIIMGHSLGANATFRMAKYLGDRGIRVRYAVAFDGTRPLIASSNISRAVNYYIPNDSKTNVIKKGAGFRGSIKNINVSRIPGMTHTTIDKTAKFHKDVLQRTLSLTRKKR